MDALLESLIHTCTGRPPIPPITHLLQCILCVYIIMDTHAVEYPGIELVSFEKIIIMDLTTLICSS